MTDEVQPLTWQKRTNIEEHQQFFAKINEIVANLAPTVEAAESALEEANTAMEEANTALTNADNAVLTANAASTAAQQASGTVAGFNSRLTAVEDNCIKKQSATPQTIDGDLLITNGHDLDVGGDFSTMGDVVLGDQMKVAGMSVERNGNKTVLSNDNGLQIASEMTVQDTDTGVSNMEAVNGNRLQNDLDAYGPMVRTTGSQAVLGNKVIGNPFNHIRLSADKMLEIGSVPKASTSIVLYGFAIERDGIASVCFTFNTSTGGRTIQSSKFGTSTIPEGRWRIGAKIDDKVTRFFITTDAENHNVGFFPLGASYAYGFPIAFTPVIAAPVKKDETINFITLEGTE